MSSGAAGELDVEFLFDDVDDLVHQQADGVVVRRDDQHRMARLPISSIGEVGQDRHQAALMHHDVAAVGALDAVGFDHFDAGDQRQRQDFRQSIAGAEQHEAGAFGFGCCLSP